MIGIYLSGTGNTKHKKQMKLIEQGQHYIFTGNRIQKERKET